MRAPIRGSRPSLLCVTLVAAGNLVLTVAQVVHVAEHGGSGRQVRRYGEQRVEGVLPVRRVVNQVAALESAGGVGVPVEADKRSLVVEGLLSARGGNAAPILEEAEEVVNAAVHTESKLRVLSGIIEGDGLSSSHGHAVIRGDRNPVGGCSGNALARRIDGVLQAAIELAAVGEEGGRDASILPVVRQNNHGV